MQLSTEDIIWLLKRPFSAEKIHWRCGNTNKRAVQRQKGDQNARPTKGMALAYVDARDVMERLDAVVGPTRWQCEHKWSDGGRLCCSIGICFGGDMATFDAQGIPHKEPGEWIWKSDGAGATQVEEEKGAFSDAFKRAGVMWGIARYLYRLPGEWVDLDERGNIKNLPSLPDWAVPNEFQSKQERDKWVTAMHKAWADRDAETLRDYKGSLTNEQQLDIWFEFTPTQRREIKEMLKEEAA